MSEDLFAELKKTMEQELRYLRRVVGEVKQSIVRVRHPTMRNIRLARNRLDDFYMSIERILESIISHFDKTVPSGREWHKELLEMTAKERPNLRPSVIDAELRERLEEFRKFRHMFSGELKWEQVLELAKKVPEVFAFFDFALRIFFEELQRQQQ